MKHKTLPKINQPGHIHFATTKIFEKNPFFLDCNCCDILLENIDSYRNEMDYKIFGYVIMPDHLHILIWFDVKEEQDEPSKQREGRPVATREAHDGVALGLPQSELAATRVGSGLLRTESINYKKITSKNAPLNISKIMHRIKGKTATDIRKELNINFKWQKGFYDFNIYTHKKFLEKLNYVHNNPYKDNRIKDPENYPYSSLRFLETGEGVLRIDKVDLYL